MSSNPETLKLAKKYLKRIKEFGEEDFLTLCVKHDARVQAGLPVQSVESVLGIEEPEPEKPVLKKSESKAKPKGCHGSCSNFAKASYGTGSCGLDENPVVPTERGCKDWKSTGDVQLLVEAHRNHLKTLMSIS